MSFAVYPQPDACKAWMPTTPLPPSMSPPSPPMVCHMPAGHDGPHSNERRPTTLSRRWEGDVRPPKPDDVTAPDRVVAVRDLLPTDNQRRAAKLLPNAMRLYYPDVIGEVAVALDEAEQRGRESVGLGDFLPDPCGDEHRARASHIAETYGDWLSCTLRRGHGGEHEHEDSGVHWPAS